MKTRIRISSKVTMRTTTTKMKTMTYDEHEDSVVGVDSDES
jgi:hypothetical protein